MIDTRRSPILSGYEIKLLMLATALTLFTITCISAQDILDTSVEKGASEMAFAPGSADKNMSNPEAGVTKHATFSSSKRYKDMNAYLASNIKFPRQAVETGRYGVLKAQMAILPDGSVGEITILQSPGELFDLEVIRVLSAMPKWKPAMRENVAVTSSQLIQLKFRLQ